MSKHRDQIIEAGKGKIDEEIVGAAFAKPRGATTAGVGGGVIVTEIGARWSGKQHKGADSVGVQLGNPGAIAVTRSSLITMEVAVSMGGQIKEIKHVLSTIPLGEVDSLTVKRMGMAGVIEIAAGGGSFKLEGKAKDMKEFAAAFERAKASA